MNTGHVWTRTEVDDLILAYSKKPSDISNREFAVIYGKQHNLSHNAVGSKLTNLKLSREMVKVVSPSPYPKFDSPLVMEGDALILPDLEMPFHNADFLNPVLDLTRAWGIRQLILAGDVLHFDSLSGWEPNWAKLEEGGIIASAEEKLMDFAQKLPNNLQGELVELIGDIGQRSESDGVSTELGIARRELHKMDKLFDRIDFVLGNHEGRLLRAMQTTLDPKELIRLLEGGDKWRIGEYYFSYLDTCKGRYTIEHPKGAAETTAQNLAAKFHTHVIMGHSHALDFSWDISGKFYAIHAGHCVDENRLAYAAQRHTTKRQHKPGAVLVANGYPYLLHEGTDWERMKGLGV
jgi:hypothetical protein